MCWLYKGKCLENPPKGYYGFVYCIVDDQGRKYWGKKAFVHKKRSKLSKRARKRTGKRVKISEVDSKWQGYWGSSKPLLEYIKQRGGTDGFTRTVVKLCKDRSSLTYWETHTLFTNNVLFEEGSWNGNILSRFFKNKIHP